MYSTKALRMVQNGRVFYVAVIPAGTLVDIAKVDAWNPDDPRGMSGYQRAPNMSRKRQIAEYVAGENAIMPAGGLLNARPRDAEGGSSYGELLDFSAEWEEGDLAYGQLSIPETAQPLYIVDMQHRLGGYEYAIDRQGHDELRDFPLVVTIADGLSLHEEVEQFHLINTTQKKVRTDLARRLLVIQVQDTDRRLALDERGRLWEAKGPVIAAILNSEEGTWQGKILPPNKSKREQPATVVRETSFVNSLKPILQTPYFVRQREEDAAKLLSRYWEAIGRAFPEAIRHPQGHVLQKTPGVFSLHAIAPEVFELARDRSGRGTIDTDTLYEVLRPLDSLGSEFWASDNEEGAAVYGSMKGFRILASQLRQLLPELAIQ
jgi:DGQHR domain-containing protein